MGGMGRILWTAFLVLSQRGILTIDWISSGQHVQGMAALLAADRRNLFLVDCISFDAMRRRSLRQVSAFDKHFEEQGFTTELST